MSFKYCYHICLNYRCFFPSLMYPICASSTYSSHWVPSPYIPICPRYLPYLDPTFTFCSAPITSSTALCCLHLSHPNFCHYFNSSLPSWLHLLINPSSSRSVYHLPALALPMPPPIFTLAISLPLFQSRWRVLTHKGYCPLPSIEPADCTEFLHSTTCCMSTVHCCPSNILLIKSP